MKRYSLISPVAALAVIISLASVAPAATITETDPNLNTWFFRDFNGNTAPSSVTLNNAQFDSIGGGTAVYDSNGTGTDPRIEFGGGAIPLAVFPNFRSRYSITGGSDSASAWRLAAVGGQAFLLPDNAAGLAEGQGTVPNANITTSGYRMDPVGSGTGWSVEYDYIVADRSRTIGIEYDHAGDDQTGNGLLYNDAVWASRTVSGGVMSGQANPGGGAASDVQIDLLGLGVDPDIYKFLEFRIKGNAGDRVDFFFSNTVTGINSLQVTPDSEGVWKTFLIDLSDEAAWSGTLDFLRLDPSVSSNGTFMVDYIRFYETAVAGPIVFSDSFDSANNSNLNAGADLSRQAGLLAPSGWTETSAGNGATTGVAIDGGQLAFTLDGTASPGNENAGAQLDQNVGSAVAGERWKIEYDLSFSSLGPDQWSSISISDNPAYGPNAAQVELGLLVRPNGTWTFFDNGVGTSGSGLIGLSHNVQIIFDETGASVLATIIIDGNVLVSDATIGFADGDRIIGLLSFLNDSASTADFIHYVDNFSIQLVPTPAALPAGLAMLTLAAARRRRR